MNDMQFGEDQQEPAEQNMGLERLETREALIHMLEQDPDRPRLQKNKFKQYKILVLGAQGVGKTYIINQYSHHADKKELEYYYSYHTNIELDFEVVQIQFLEPIEQDLNKFMSIFQVSLQKKDFDGIMMVAANKDINGTFLKESCEYLSDIKQQQLLQQLENMPTVLLVTNNMEQQAFRRTSAFGLQESNVKDAMKFAMKTIGCEAQEVRTYLTEDIQTEQIDAAFHKLIELIDDDKISKKKKKSMRQQGQKFYKKLQNLSYFKKLKYGFQILLFFQCVSEFALPEQMVSLIQAFLNVKLSLIIQNNYESWICNINIFLGFFSFFSGILGYYGSKHKNKEYIGTNSILMRFTEDLATTWILVIQTLFCIGGFVIAYYVKKEIYKIDAKSDLGFDRIRFQSNYQDIPEKDAPDYDNYQRNGSQDSDDISIMIRSQLIKTNTISTLRKTKVQSPNQTKSPRTVIKKQLSDMNRPPSSGSTKSSHAVAEIQQLQQNGVSFKEYMTMKVLPPEQQPTQQQPNASQQSTYKGSLASQKYFNPKELNSLHLSKKAAETSKPIVREELKKTNGPVKVQHGLNQMQIENDQQSSFGSSLDQEQQEKLKNLNRRPFSVKSGSRQGSRPQTAQSDQNQQTSASGGGSGVIEKENLERSGGQFYLENDVYEEISIPEVDYEERNQLLRQLDQRQKDREELDLEECFRDFKSKGGLNDSDIDNLSVYSQKEIKEDKQINIYKPTLKKAGGRNNNVQVVHAEQTPQKYNNQMKNTPQPQGIEFYPSSLVAVPTGVDTGSRMEQIYKQLKDLQSFKDEIMNDLDEFMDETQSMMTIPEQFDEVVDIVINEQREKGEQIVESQMRGRTRQQQEIYDETGKPFWMKFLKADYLEEENQNNANKGGNSKVQQEGKVLAKKISELTDKEKKIQKAFEKIRMLDAQLAHQTKVERDFKNAILSKKQDDELRKQQKLEQNQMVQIQQQQQKMSQTQSKVGTAKKQVPARAASKGKPPSQGASRVSSKQQLVNSQQEQQQDQDDYGDTFLTDTMFKGKRPSKKQSTKNSQVAEEEDEFDSDELQDVVYDYEQSHAIMDMADDYLQRPLLSLPPISEDSPIKGNPQNQTSTSFRTNMSTSTKKDFLSLNKDQAKNFNPYKKPMICDQLDDESKNRLDDLIKGIDDNLEDIIKEKEEFFQADINKSQITTKDPSNAYLYSREDMQHMERINESLLKIAPMLLPAEDDTQSIMSGNKSKGGYDHSKMSGMGNIPSYDHSKFLDDKQSVRSVPMSAITRRSNFTMLTHQPLNLNQKLPKERKLREIAEQRILQGQLRDIDNNLRRINNTDDLSYAVTSSQPVTDSTLLSQQVQQVGRQLVDEETLMRLIEECREEEDRMSIMNEMNNNEDSRVHTAGYTERSIVALAKIEEKEKIYQEAEETFKEIEIAKQKYYHALESLSEREGAIQDIEDRVNRLSKKSQQQESKLKKRSDLKQQLLDQEQEVKTILENLDVREQQIKMMQDRDREIFEVFEKQALNNNIDDRIMKEGNEDEEDEMMQRIQRDMQDYQDIEKEFEEMTKQEDVHNREVLRAIENLQVGRNDNQNELLEFANQQLDQYDQQQLM